MAGRAYRTERVIEEGNRSAAILKLTGTLHVAELPRYTPPQVDLEYSNAHR